MTSTYLNQLINEFDQEFESLIIPFPKSLVVTTPTEVEDVVETNLIEDVDDQNALELLDIAQVPNENSATLKLEQIKALATKISAERYDANYNPEISWQIY